MKLIRKIMATATAAACVVAFNTVAVSSAFAASSDTATVAVTVLDIENPTDPNPLRNCYVTVSADATVADVLEEAGFDKVATAEESAAEPYFTYYESYGYPQFSGKGYNEDKNMWWIDLYNGEMDMDGMTELSHKVVNGSHYQFIYDTAAIDPITQSAEYNYTYGGDGPAALDDPLSANVVNNYCQYIISKTTKKNVDYKFMVMDDIENVYAVLSDAEKAKVDYDIVMVRDDLIRSADGIAVKAAANKTVKAKKNAKKTVTLKAITSASGNKVWYMQKTKNAKVTVSKTGKITVKKGLKKTASIKVAAYCGVAATKNITIKVKAA